jgi:1,4-dihydroxy-2-naphthoate octaprenyltransferase
MFIIAAYALIAGGIFFGLTKVYCLICFVSMPLAIKSALSLRKDPQSIDNIVPSMASTVTYSRITGFLLALSYIL